MLNATTICKRKFGSIELHEFEPWERIIQISNGCEYTVWTRCCMHCGGYTEPVHELPSYDIIKDTPNLLTAESWEY